MLNENDIPKNENDIPEIKVTLNYANIENDFLKKKDRKPSIQIQIGRSDYNEFNLVKTLGLEKATHEYKDEGDYCVYTFYGKRPLYFILNKLLEKNWCPKQEKELIACRNVIKRALKKPSVKLPLRGVLKSKFKENNKNNSTSIKSANVVKKVIGPNEVLYYYKENPMQRKIGEFEAGMSWIFAAFIPGQAALSRCVYDDETNEKVATVSKEIENFKSLRELYIDGGVTQSQEDDFVKEGGGEVMSTSLIFQNDDLNLENIGHNGKKICILDFGRTLFKKTSSYSGFAPDKKRKVTKGVYESPSESFTLSGNDFFEFPFIEVAKPNQSLARENVGMALDWKKIKKNKRFQFGVRKQLIKAALIDEEFYKKVAEAHFTSESGKVAFVSELTEISRNAAEEIKNTPELRVDLENNNSAYWKAIESDFEAYNKLCEEESCSELKINLEKLKEKYEKFTKTLSENYCFIQKEKNDAKDFVEPLNEKIESLTTPEQKEFKEALGRLSTEIETKKMELPRIEARTNPVVRKKIAQLREVKDDAIHLIEAIKEKKTTEEKLSAVDYYTKKSISLSLGDRIKMAAKAVAGAAIGLVKGITHTPNDSDSFISSAKLTSVIASDAVGVGSTVIKSFNGAITQARQSYRQTMQMCLLQQMKQGKNKEAADIISAAQENFIPVKKMLNEIEGILGDFKKQLLSQQRGETVKFGFFRANPVSDELKRIKKLQEEITKYQAGLFTRDAKVTGQIRTHAENAVKEYLNSKKGIKIEDLHTKLKGIIDGNDTRNNGAALMSV